VARTGVRARVVAKRDEDVGEQEGPHEAPSSWGLFAEGGGIVVGFFVVVVGRGRGCDTRLEVRRCACRLMAAA
jgi:hypothetical protein